MVSPLRRDGTARKELRSVVRTWKKPGEERSRPTLSSAEQGRARLVVLAATVGGRWFQETAQFLRGFALF